MNYSELRSVTVARIAGITLSYGSVTVLFWRCSLSSYETMVSIGLFMDAVLYNALAELQIRRALDHGVSDLASMWC